MSTTQNIEYGVPQGSVLGPLLFILYSNDIPNSLTYCQAILFADDTTVYLTGDNLQTMHDKVNTDLYTLNDWFRANQLSVNSSKTKYILFSKYGNVLTHGMFLHIDNEHLERVKAAKFLEIHIDEHLTWEHHVNHRKKKVSQGVYAINMSKHILGQKHLNILYHSLVHPYLLYGIRLWGSALKRFIGKLEIAQKKAMRAMTGARYNDPSSPLFKRLNILKLNDLFELASRS